MAAFCPVGQESVKMNDFGVQSERVLGHKKGRRFCLPDLMEFEISNFRF